MIIQPIDLGTWYAVRATRLSRSTFPVLPEPVHNCPTCALKVRLPRQEVPAMP